ncbi:hypothetical protein D9O36_10185 [Zobellia amurskyensis]|uniref:Uncharacterized protein n=1 Tax=Zobellia amurskyensis TaxID=248905 RepID=A0A7X2ZTP2_9FLAO|nr:hypothetical protein [Zobellia amurskyensis]MUH36210.1 hypothetical protein [Zobellia amurskyensis]
MEQALTATFTKQEHIQTNELQLHRLERNLRDIAQLYAKLCSYMCEPRTYDQFMRLDELKEDALILRNSNKSISQKLRQEPNASARCYRLFLNYIQGFDTFVNEVDGYVKTV